MFLVGCAIQSTGSGVNCSAQATKIWISHPIKGRDLRSETSSSTCGRESCAATELESGLQEQPFQILALLLERAGEVVTREELQRKLWAADTFVDFDNGLNIAIKKLRTALGDDAEAPRYIETLPRRGYRFLAQVTVDTAEPARPSAPRRAPLVLVPKQEEPADSATVPESVTPLPVHPGAGEFGHGRRVDCAGCSS